MAALNSVSYICSAGVNSVTSAGSLGPYFAIKYFLPLYNYSFDTTLCKLTSGSTSAASISALNLTSATASSLSAFETIYKTNPFGNYNLLTNKSVYYTAGMGAGPYYTNIKQTVFDTKVNSLNASPLSNIVTAGTWTYPSTGALSASGGYGNVNALSFNPLSASTSAWANYLYRVNSYSPTQNTSAGYARGSFKCRIPSGTGSFKFNAMALFATRVNQFGYDDPGVTGSPFNPTLFAIVVFDTPQIKNDLAGALNAFELNVELNFQLANPSSQIIFVNKDYFSRIPTSNVTSAYALSYDGDLVLSTSAEPGSWVPRAKATFVDPSKDQLRLSYDESHYTTFGTKSISPNALYITASQKMSVLSIDTACPDDSLLQLGYQCVATGIKSFAGGCFTSATGLNESSNIDFGSNSPVITNLYQGGRGGYTFAFGVDSIAAGLVSQAFGLETSSIGFANLAVGYRSYAESPMSRTTDSLPALGGNVAIGFGTSAFSTDQFYATPEGAEYESCSNLSTLINDYELAGGNFATNVLTVASGKGASSFGIATKSLGNATTSFGLTTSAIGCASVSFGTNTKSVGEMSIAAGYNTSAHGSTSFVGGSYARTSIAANGSFVWSGQIDNSSEVIKRNVLNYVDGTYVLVPLEKTLILPSTETFSESPSTIIMGKGTSAIGYGYSVGIGPINNLSDGSSFAFGLGNSATSTNTFAIGEFNIVDGFGSFGIGAVNNVAGAYNLTIGENNTSTGDHAYTFGISNTNMGLGPDGSFVIGSFNTNIGNNVVAGSKNIVNGTANTIFGTNNSVNGNYVTHIGYRNKSTGANYVKNGFVGGEKSGINATVAGTAFVESTNIANPFSGVESFYGSMFAFGYASSAMAPGAVALGTSTVASGIRSISIGSNNQANSLNSIAIGSYAITNGDNSMAIGQATANGSNSLAIGKVTATDPNSVVIGNNLGDTSIYSKNIYLSAYRADGVKSRIQLDADEIILNGYDNDKARTYFGMTLCRNRDAVNNNSSSSIYIKISKVRCDELSGKIEGISIKISTDTTLAADLVTMYRHKNGITTVDPLYSLTPMGVGLVMFKPETMDIFFGNKTTTDEEILSKLSDGWVIIARTYDDDKKTGSGKMAHHTILNYWLFNNLKYLSIKLFTNDRNQSSIDNVYTSIPGFEQHQFTSTLDYLGTRVNFIYDSNTHFSEISFFNRIGTPQVTLSTYVPNDYSVGGLRNKVNAATGNFGCNFGSIYSNGITVSDSPENDVNIDGDGFFDERKILFVDFV